MPPNLNELHNQPCVSAYVHVPFCTSKCAYCDFNSHPGLDHLHSDYVEALLVEVDSAEGITRNKVPLRTVYVGGGTPTVLSADQLSAILGAIRDSFGLDDECEVTTEANPGTVTLSKYEQLLAGGFNRISLGIQSFDDSLLEMLGRMHTSSEAVGAFVAARAAGFANVSLDLMYALPGQSLRQWTDTLKQAVDLAPEHISLYELTIEEGTRFSELCKSGTIVPANDKLQLSMYEKALETITSAGYEHYEVSNFARHGFRCRHNITYWRNQPYYGFGAGATSYISGVRSVRVSEPEKYIAAIEGGCRLISNSECVEGVDLVNETLMLGLRMLEGVDLVNLSQRTGVDVESTLRSRIERLEKAGLLIRKGSTIRVTHRGLLLLNSVISTLML